jgi:hypothetical protein
MMVVGSIIGLFAKPKVIFGAFKNLFGKRRQGADVLGHIELPLWISGATSSARTSGCASCVFSTWCPFGVQAYFNGHNVLAAKLRKAGIEHRMLDNAPLQQHR